MKAIPFICSRTKYMDFIPDYLVRPSDFEWQEAKGKVGNAMYDLHSLRDIRYAVFAAGNYCVFGIACVSKHLANRIGTSVDNNYLMDKGRRSLACFMGFAVPIPENKGNVIPKNIASEEFLIKIWNVYFEYL